MLRIALIGILVLSLSSCVTTSPVIVYMHANNEQLQLQNIKFRVERKLPGVANLGGDVGGQNIKFENVTPWLKSRLGLVSLPCHLKHKPTLILKLDKMYLGLTSETLFGTLVLSGEKYYGHQRRQVSYRGECEADFLWINPIDQVKSCMNSAMDEVVDKIKLGLCR